MTTKKIISILIVLIFIVAVFILWNVFGPTVKNPDKKFLYIPTNSTYEQVKDSLKSGDFIPNSFIYEKVANYADYPQNVKPGKYKITEGMSVYSLIKVLRTGKQEPVNLVITKLRTKEDLAKRISKSFEVDSLEVIRFLNNPVSLSKFDVDTLTVMTDVIPNTYTYLWTTPINAIFTKLDAENKKFWNKERMEKGSRLNLTPKEVYILASIVEEETNKQEDKGKIASVYINRMHKGMRLAADPTVKYAMRDFGLKRIYHKHLAFPSPYNTYQNAGLPPGPICTPSIKTIDAVLDAPDTDYIFFVARADFSGFSDFASTYQQHLIYAKAYQQALDKAIMAKQAKEKDESLK